jgi:hypothetical protein
MADSYSWSDVVQVASSLTDGQTAGRIVGKIPLAKIFQIEVPASSREALDSFIEQAMTYPMVEAAFYNVVAKPTMCMSPDDNYQAKAPGDKSDCAWLDIQYPQALALFKRLEKVIAAMSGNFRQAENAQRAAGSRPVTVMLIDSGLNYLNGRFTTLANNIERVGWTYEPSDATGFDPYNDGKQLGHGTSVGHIIAGDSDGYSGNGLTSAFLGRDLRLLVAPPDLDVVAVLVALATYGGNADVVNISMGEHLFGSEGSEYELIFRTIMENTPDLDNTLIVASAPNTPYLFGSGSPMGLFTLYSGILREDLSPYDNILPVTGTEWCNPSKLCMPGNCLNLQSTAIWTPTGSYYGMSAAPSEQIPTVNRDGIQPDSPPSGASLATAQITALAAIMKWVSPTLTPREIRDMVRGTISSPLSSYNYYLPQDSFGKHYFFPNFLGALGANIWQTSQGTAFEWLMEYYTSFMPPTYVAPERTELVMGRVCGEFFAFQPECSAAPCAPIVYTHEHLSHWAPNEYLAMINIQDAPPSWQIVARIPSATYLDYSLKVGCPDLCEIRLNEPYLIGQHISVSYETGDGDMFAQELPGGYVEFTQCEIVARNQDQHRPYAVLFWGELSNLELGIDYNLNSVPYDPKYERAPVAGSIFSLTAYVSCGTNPQVCNDLEDNCYGGRP